LFLVEHAETAVGGRQRGLLRDGLPVQPLGGRPICLQHFGATGFGEQFGLFLLRRHTPEVAAIGS
jgi:hypothetical protein